MRKFILAIGLFAATLATSTATLAHDDRDRDRHYDRSGERPRYRRIRRYSIWHQRQRHSPVRRDTGLHQDHQRRQGRFPGS